MRLISLDIQNFRVIKKTSLVFPDSVIGIVGRNGAGKSTIIEAIAWALYGNQAARTGKDEIKSNFARQEEDCEVNLVFSINGEEYRIIRRLTGWKDRAEVELYRGMASESIGVSETKNHIARLLGLDWKGFLTSFLARQQELNALSDLQPHKRKDHLAGMLGIEKLDNAIQLVKPDARLYGEQAVFLQRRLDELPGLVKAIEDLIGKVDQLTALRKNRKSEAKEAESIFNKDSSALKLLQDTRARWLQMSARLDAEQKSQKNLQDRLQDLKKELVLLNQAETGSRELRERIKDYGSVRNELELLKEARTKKSHHVQLTEQSKSFLEERDDLNKKLSDSNRKLVQYQEQLKSYPDNLEELLAEKRQELEKARDEFSNLQMKHRAVEIDIARLNDQMNSISQFGPESICDRCLRPLGDDLPEIKEHLKKELDNLSRQAKQSKAHLDRIKQNGEQLASDTTQLDKQFEQRKDIVREHENVMKEKTRWEESIGRLNNRLEEITGKIEQMGMIEFGQVAFDNLQKKLLSLESDRSELNRLEGSLTRLPEVHQQIDDIQQKIKQTKKEIDADQEVLQQMDYNDERYQEANRRFDQSQKAFEATREEYTKVNHELQMIRKELEIKQQQQKDLELTAKELKEKQSGRFYTEKLVSLFGQYRTWLISSIRPTLADLSSRLISDMTDGRYSMIELDDKYNLKILDYGEFFEVERFSGGEKDLANLCLRLAISRTLTESAGLERSFVILDEVFGSQDSERRELIVKALGKLTHRFPQILLITHLEDIKDKVELLIEVEPTSLGYSEVKVYGQAT